MVDVLWTDSNQSDPRWGKDPCKPNVLHDLISAVLTTGPVGIGDRLGRTNTSLLARAMRIDGTILKPASAALRLDRFYDRQKGGAEIWAAPSRPGDLSDPSTDAVANSMADMQKSTGEAWAWLILATNAIHETAPIATSELWPRPPQDTVFLVAQLEHISPTALKPSCVNGSLVEDCLFLWTNATRLPVATGSTRGTPGCIRHNFTLLSATPVLSSGWALLGTCFSRFSTCSSHLALRRVSAQLL